MNKQSVLNALRKMPDEFEPDEFIERIILIDKIEKGIEQSKQGKVIPMKKVVEHFRKKWKK